MGSSALLLRPKNDAELIRCVLGMTLNSSIVVLTQPHPHTFGRVDEAVSGRKPPAGKGVVGLLS